MRLALLVMGSILGCVPVAPGDTAVAVEICDDGVDNDSDGAVDCADSDCPPCVEICDDGVDNDADGRVDCSDWACIARGFCDEICDDGVDNDLDGAVDCLDLDCRRTEPCVEICDDGVDNDLDGAVDCADSDCRRDSACLEDCGDGVDNDLDGLVDCEDGDCDGPPCFEDCANGVDDDGDGLVDCDDDECVGLDCHLDGVRITVMGGHMVLARHEVDVGGAPWYGWDRGVVTLRDVVGVVRVVPPGQRWAGATGSTTCAFGFDSADLSLFVDGPSVDGPWSLAVDTASRVGTWVDEGCRLDRVDSFLRPWDETNYWFRNRESGFRGRGTVLRVADPPSGRHPSPVAWYVGSSPGSVRNLRTSIRTFYDVDWKLYAHHERWTWEGDLVPGSPLWMSR